MGSALRPILAALLVASAAAAALPSRAAAPLIPASQLCRPAIVAAEISARLPARLLEAIALIESGRLDKQSGRRTPWPWTINAEGEGYFFDSKAQAISAVKSLQSRGVMSIDVGCMQVNLLHHPGAFVNLDQAFDPTINARYAARFMNDLYGRTISWPLATAFYHSQTPALGAAYQRRVMAVWERPMQAQPIPVYNAGFAAFSRSGYVDILQGSDHFRAFVPASQTFAAFGRGR